MTLNIIYRCTVYASRGVDPTEATILTPTAGTALPTVNWLLQSQAWATAPWTTSNLSATNNNQVAPDGTTTATNLVPNNVNINLHEDLQNVTITANEQVNFSGFFKANGYGGLYLRMTDGGGANNFGIIVDLVGGLNVTQVGGGGVVTGTAVVPLANGWFWVGVSGTIGAGVTAAIYQAIVYDTYAHAQAQTAFIGDTVSGILAWGGQVERNGAATVAPAIANYVLTTASTGTAVFRIATSEGIIGFRPYMGIPKGRRGRLDLLSKKTDTGQMDFDVVDVRATPGGSNAVRWMTGFTGDHYQRPAFAKLKVFIEESLDDGATFTPFFTGRTSMHQLPTGRVKMRLTVKDFTDDLSYNIFVGMPHGNVYQTSTGGGYAQLVGVMPVGLVHPYGNAPLAANNTGVLSGFVQAVDARGWALVSFNPSQVALPDNQYTSTLHQATLGWGSPLSLPVTTPAPTVTPTFSGMAIAHVTMLNATGTAAGTQSSTTLGDTTKAWTVNQWVGRTVTLTGGTGSGQTRVVLSNTATVLTVVSAWGTTPVAGSTTYSLAAEGDFYVGYGFVPTPPNKSYAYGTPYGSTQCWGLCIRPMAYPLGAFNAGLGDAPKANGALTAAPTAGSSVVTTKGWRLSTTSVLKQGDIISFAGHLQRYTVGRPVVSSDGSGNATATIAPGLRSAVADGEVITVQVSPGLMALPPANTLITVSVVCDMKLADGGQKDSAGNYLPGNILLIGGGDGGNGYMGGGAHPVQVLKDVALGYYGFCYRPQLKADGQSVVLTLPPGKNVGDPQLPIAINTTAATPGNVTDLIADTSFPAFRCPIDKIMPIRDFIEQYICKDYGLGYYFDGAGVMQVVDLRGPTSVGGIPAITDADLIDDVPPTWAYDATQGYSVADVRCYGEAILPPASQLQTGGMFPVITSKMFDAQAGDMYDLTVGNPDLGYRLFTFDGKGYRAMPGEVLYVVGDPNLGLGAIGAANNQRWPVVQAEADAMVRNILRPYGNGLQTATFTCARTTNVTGIWPGTFFTATVSSIPDPAANVRGSTRLYCCVERREDGPQIAITGVDWGRAVSANPPTLITPTTVAGDTANACQTDVTPNAQGQGGEVWVAVTSTAVGTRPIDTSPLWHSLGGYLGFMVTNVIAFGKPGGSRVWWRARTSFGAAATVKDPTNPISMMQLPSAWVYPSTTGGTDFVDLTTFTAPTGLATSLVTTQSFVVTWANPDASLATEIWVSQPIGALRVFVARLPPGSTTFTLRGLLASTTYRVAVRAVDGKGGYAEATIDQATAAATPVPILPPPIGIRVGTLLF